jgi:hypothetical protein
MANFELKFLDSFNKKTIQVKKNSVELFTKNKDVITILSIDFSGFEIEINLDKSTAIKFAKTLRTEINKIIESEVNNG